MTAEASSLKLPTGFSATVFAESVGPARHMVVRQNGDVYVRLRSPKNGHCNVALRDTNKDFKADTQLYFGGADCGTGIALKEPYLYTSSRQKVYRTRLPEIVADSPLPKTEPEVLITDLGVLSAHSARSLVIHDSHLFVNVGAPSNACQMQDRRKGSPGQDPCPLLESFGGIYRFSLTSLGQTKSQGVRYASGIRNAVAMDWSPMSQKLHAVQHGRDQLGSLFPELYDVKANAELPAEELFAIDQGDDFGWPYCYYDPQKKQKVEGPEYGGNGSTVGRCKDAKDPFMAFPAHYAPNDLLFYRPQQNTENATAFPERYHDGAFIAFHGSWNRAPLPQEGYQVVFASFANKTWEVFADGFSDKELRPMGLAQTPTGALLVVDSQQGKVWRISPS